MYKILNFIIIFYFFSLNICWAQTSNKPDVKDKLLKSYAIMQKKDFQNMPLVIDYSIEILNQTPNSIASYFAVNGISLACSLEDANDEMKSNFKNLYDKYFSDLDNLQSDTMEKIILSEFLFSGYSINEMTYDEMDKSHQIGKNALEKIINNCANDDYAALATMFLFSRLPSNEIVTWCEKFIAAYPSHKAIPLVEFKMIMEKYFFDSNSRDYSKFIEECNKLIEKYKEIDSPYGNYKLANHFYELIVCACINMNNVSEAQKYLEIIKKEAPGYHELPEIENEIEVYMHNHGIKN